MTGATPDPLGSAALRAAVLQAWAASPTRFREDANAEERLAHGYGGRAIAELVANGADAAAAAGAPGEILIRLHGRTVTVANTGAALTPAGLASLSSLRASAKRGDDGVGHFGVGFTAVRELSDAPEIIGPSGAIGFSADRTRAAVQGLGVADLDAELRSRGGLVPALRLPWPIPSPQPPPAGYTTAVRLPLAPSVDGAALAGQLTAAFAADLLWALPGLAAITVELTGDPGEAVSAGRPPQPGDGPTRTRTVRVIRTETAEPGIEELRVDGDDPAGLAGRYRVARATGTLPAALLAALPVEEQARGRWSVQWITPVDRPAPSKSAVGAPTPIDDEIAVPARLIATLPIDETRRHVADGPMAALLAEHAAAAYLDLVLRTPPAGRLALVPAPGFPLCPFDQLLRAAIGDALSGCDFLPQAAGGVVAPRRAVAIPALRGRAAALIGEALPGLVDWPDRVADVERLRSLSVRTAAIAVATAALHGIERPTAFWTDVYDGLAGFPVDELTDLPVPRHGGGTLPGPRGALLPEGGAADDEAPAWLTGIAAAVPRLRLARAGVDHALLCRLGARPAGPADVLGTPELAAEIRRRADDLDAGIDPDEADDYPAGPQAELDPVAATGSGAGFSAAVLELVAAAGPDRPLPPALADLLLTDTDGEWWAAADLLLPGAALHEVLDPEVDIPEIGSDWIRRFGEEVLVACGVRDGFAVIALPLPPDEHCPLADVDEWWREVGEESAGPAPAFGDEPADAARAVTDLDLVLPERWLSALAMIASRRRTRDALRRTEFGPSYSAWWIARHAVVDGLAPRQWRRRDAGEIAGLYDPFPADLPDDLLADIGVLGALADAARDPVELLARWADPARMLPPWRVPAVTAALAAALHGEPDLPLPDTVRVLTGETRLAADVFVLDEPQWAQVVEADRLVAGGADPSMTADAFDLPLATEELSADPETGDGATITTLGELPAGARALGCAGRPDLADRAAVVAPALAVRVTGDGDTAPRPVTWWPTGDELFVDGSAEGIGRAVARLAGRWADRYLFVAAAHGRPQDSAESGVE